MAADVIKIDAGLNDFGTQAAASSAVVALSTSGKTVDLEGKDGYILLLFSCTANDNTITLVGGNGAKGGQDATLSQLDANKVGGVVIDSAYFMDVSGTTKGMITIKGKSTTSVQAIELKAGR